MMLRILSRHVGHLVVLLTSIHQTISPLIHRLRMIKSPFGPAKEKWCLVHRSAQYELRDLAQEMQKLRSRIVYSSCLSRLENVSRV